MFAPCSCSSAWGSFTRCVQNVCIVWSRCVAAHTLEPMGRVTNHVWLTTQLGWHIDAACGRTRLVTVAVILLTPLRLATEEERRKAVSSSLARYMTWYTYLWCCSKDLSAFSTACGKYLCLSVFRQRDRCTLYNIKRYSLAYSSVR